MLLRDKSTSNLIIVIQIQKTKKVRVGTRKVFFLCWCYAPSYQPKTFSCVASQQIMIGLNFTPHCPRDKIGVSFGFFPQIFVLWNEKETMGQALFFLRWWDGACCIAPTRKKLLVSPKLRLIVSENTISLEPWLSS